MTSEVVVMNRIGIALASDSAATIVKKDGRPKMFHADKLFMLSKHHPVGIMNYEQSDLLCVQWETIVKMYRHQLGRKGFPTLQEYADNFIAYLDNNASLFPENVQENAYLDSVRKHFKSLSLTVEKAIGTVVWNWQAEDGEALRSAIAKSVILSNLEAWEKSEDATCYDPQIASEIVGKFSGELTQIALDYFKGWKLDAEAMTALKKIDEYIISKASIAPDSLSGIVIAGYGENEHFPALVEYQIGGVFKGRLKFLKVSTANIDAETDAVIRPFAESEMVNTFLYGIAQDFEKIISAEFTKLLLALPHAIVGGLKIGKKRKKQYIGDAEQAVREESPKNISEFFSRCREEHAKPVIEAVAFMPKSELAHVATSLVNLNAFQKRTTTSEDETVGGPIDVAVISKGDGFVWIARKHYFPRELNHHFFRNYVVLGNPDNGGQNGNETTESGNEAGS